MQLIGFYLLRRSMRGKRGFRRAVAQGFITNENEKDTGSKSDLHMESETFKMNIGETRELDMEEVNEIMKEEGVTFDEARAIRQNRLFEKQGIHPSGVPKDPKVFTFNSGNSSSSSLKAERNV